MNIRNTEAGLWDMAIAQLDTSKLKPQEINPDQPRKRGKRGSRRNRRNGSMSGLGNWVQRIECGSTRCDAWMIEMPRGSHMAFKPHTCMPSSDRREICRYMNLAGSGWECHQRRMGGIQVARRRRNSLLDGLSVHQQWDS